MYFLAPYVGKNLFLYFNVVSENPNN